MGEIRLERLIFYSHHGVFQSERTNGNKFSVDVCLKADLAKAAKNDDLKDTIDYVLIYSIGRTIEREDKFRWLGEIIPMGYNLYGFAKKKSVEFAKQ